MSLYLQVHGTSSPVCEYRSAWDEIEIEALVYTWKENFLRMQTLDKDKAFDEIVVAVNVVGKKTSAQCKRKLQNLKDQYKKAKDANSQSGESFNTSPYFETFDEVLGSRHEVTIPHLNQAGVATAAGEILVSVSHKSIVLMKDLFSNIYYHVRFVICNRFNHYGRKF